MSDLRFDNFSANNNFIDDEIGNVTRTSDGYIWTCSAGLTRFDGKTYRRYSNHKADNKGIRNDYCDDLIEDPYHRLWVGNAGGLCYYDRTTDSFVYLHPKEISIDYAFSFNVVGNKLWFVCDQGLCSIDLKTLKVRATALHTVTDPVSNSTIDEHTLVIGSRTEYYIYHIDEDRYERGQLVHNNGIARLHSCLRIGGKLYLGTSRGIWIFTQDLSHATILDGTEQYYVTDLALVPSVTGDTMLWFGTQNSGLNLFDLHRNKVDREFLHDASKVNSISSNLISKLHLDSDNILWIGTEKGLSSINFNDQSYKTNLLRFNEGVVSDNVVGDIQIVKERPTTLMMACYNQGLLQLDWTTKNIKQYREIDLRKCGGKSTSQILSLAQATPTSWLLNGGGQIMVWDTLRGVTKVANEFPLPQDQRAYFNIRSVVHTKGDTFFVLSSCGLFMYQLTANKLTALRTGPYSDHPTDNDLVGGVFDGGDIVWIASRCGLLKYDIRSRTSETYKVTEGQDAGKDNFMFDVACGNGIVVCATSRGLAVFDTHTRHFRVISEFAGIREPFVSKVGLFDGVAWLATNTGPIAIDINSNKVRVFDNGNSSTTTLSKVDNEIIIGFRGGYAYIDTGDVFRTPQPSPPLIENVKINNQLDLIPTEGNTEVFKSEQNIISISFTAFEFSDPEHIQFRYRMSGLSTTWNYAATDRSATFAHLPPGAYSFEVQAANDRGEWNSRSATFTFRILPPFWQTWWFRSLVAGLLALVLYSIFRYRINSIKKLEQIRRKIAADFHDDLGSTLSSISIYSEVARQSADKDLLQTKKLLGEIGEKTRSMITSMNDMIWSVKPDNDTIGKLLQYMQEFGLVVAEAKNVTLTFDVPKELHSVKLSMIVRKNLYYIYKESLNNALKYSHASKIEVTFTPERHGYVMRIRDNGVGFDILNIKRGNGLNNIDKRVKEMNGTIERVSIPGEGTVITCHFKIT